MYYMNYVCMFDVMKQSHRIKGGTTGEAVQALQGQRFAWERGAPVCKTIQDCFTCTRTYTEYSRKGTMMKSIIFSFNIYQMCSFIS